MSAQPWSVVVPVKTLATAKTRLAPLPAALRAELALALATDTVTAALSCPAVGAVVVVTDDERAAAAVRALGATVVADEPDAGLNPALEHGARVAIERVAGTGVVALSADLPAATADAIEALIRRAAMFDRVVVADHDGTGTTALTARPGVALQPEFGPGSFGRHLASGAHPVDDVVVAALRRDVDTVDDLERAAELGVGAATGRLLAEVRAARRQLS